MDEGGLLDEMPPTMEMEVRKKLYFEVLLNLPVFRSLSQVRSPPRRSPRNLMRTTIPGSPVCKLGLTRVCL
jgi:hypothetical protein